MKKLSLLFLSCCVMFSLAGCDNKIQKEIKGEYGGMSGSIRYFKDKKTGFCYSVIEEGASGASNYAVSHTLVPCTPEVEKLLVNK